MCCVSVDLTSDLAEYGKEESAESTLCAGVRGVPASVCMCFVACVRPRFCVGGERRE